MPLMDDYVGFKSLLRDNASTTTWSQELEDEVHNFKREYALLHNVMADMINKDIVETGGMF